MAKAGFGAALMALGGIGMDRQKEAREQKEKEELARLAAIAEREKLKVQAEFQAPKYETFDATQDGKSGKRTVRTKYDPATGGFVEEDVAFAANEPKAPTTRSVRDGSDEVTQEFDAATGGWREIGRGPKFRATGGGGGGGRAAKADKPPKASSLTQTEIEALFGATAKDGSLSVDPNAYKQFLAFQARNAARDPNFRDAKFAAQQWANQVGVDESERLPGTIDPDEFNAPVLASAPANQAAAAKPAGARPGASRDNPAPAAAFTSKPPPGTWVQLPDGRVIQIPN